VNIEAEEEETEDRITIEDINITTEMNLPQLAIKQQEKISIEEDSTTEEVTTHG